MSAVETLAKVVSHKPDGADRLGQREMTEGVEAALANRTHLFVEAGTGTGKSLAYLVPAVASGGTVVISTATKALQNQLSTVDLPFLKDVLGDDVTWAVLKGRQSYLCMAKLVEQFGDDLSGAGGQLFEVDADATELAAWAKTEPSGDRDDLERAVSDDTWRTVSVSGMECPGAVRCPQGDRCFAESAVRAAAEVRIVITNHHLYGLNLGAGGRILPDHDAVIFDEAHKLEGALSSAFGVEITPGRFTHFAGQLRRVVADRPDRDGRNFVAELRQVADDLRSLIADLPLERIEASHGDMGVLLRHGQAVVSEAVRRVKPQSGLSAHEGITARVQQQGGHLAGDIGYLASAPEGAVAWNDGNGIRIAPIEIAGQLASKLLVDKPAVLTSATLAVGSSFSQLAARLGFLEQPLDPDPLAEDVEDPISRTYEAMQVPGSFDYSTQGLLYVASHLPDPREDSFVPAALDEIERLVTAAGGKALVLTTSHRMVSLVAERLDGGRHPLLVQGALPKGKLIDAFAGDESSILVATMGYWEGIDVPGPSLSLVIIDKLPFPRPDDPLVQARREAVTARGGSSFNEVDLPAAAMLAAQGSGRLIRGETDRGVVAILDNRLTKMRYGIRVIRSLPPMARTSDPERALRFLRDLA